MGGNQNQAQCKRKLYLVLVSTSKANHTGGLGRNAPVLFSIHGTVLGTLLHVSAANLLAT